MSILDKLADTGRERDEFGANGYPTRRKPCGACAAAMLLLALALALLLWGSGAKADYYQRDGWQGVALGYAVPTRNLEDVRLESTRRRSVSPLRPAPRAVPTRRNVPVASHGQVWGCVSSKWRPVGTICSYWVEEE